MYGPLFLLFLAVMPSSYRINASPVNQDNSVHTVNIRLIKEFHSRDEQRTSFSDDSQAPNLPDQLIFGVPIQPEREAILSLKRTSLIPVITSQGRTQTLNEGASVYTDATLHSTVIVRRDAGDYSLLGTFFKSGKEWNLQPLGRNSRSSTTHQISPNQEQQTISLEGDAYTVGGKPAEPIRHRNLTRHKRSLTQHVVETALVVDHGDYQKWVTYFGSSNAISEMQLWYTYVAESINIRYTSITETEFAIAFRATSLKIITNDAEDDFIEDLVMSGTFNGLDGLNAFKSWVGNQADIPSSDHYMLFTGYDMIGAAGMAFTGAVCTESSVSITENNFQASVAGIAAHELGHSLSANHDSSSGCDDNSQYIMATVFSVPVRSGNAGNPWTFSDCSWGSIQSYLNGQTCTLPAATTSTDALPAPASGSRAGEVLSLDDQCRLDFRDSGSYFCSSIQPDLSQICGGIYCHIPGGDGSCQSLLPQEFTPCGDSNGCFRGECVSNSTFPETSSTATPTEPETFRTCLTHIPGDWGSWISCMIGDWVQRKLDPVYDVVESFVECLDSARGCLTDKQDKGILTIHIKRVFRLSPGRISHKKC